MTSFSPLTFTNGVATTAGRLNCCEPSPGEPLPPVHWGPPTNTWRGR